MINVRRFVFDVVCLGGFGVGDDKVKDVKAY